MKTWSFFDIRRFENAHILLWLIKDLCWVSDFHTLGVIMIIPTALVALYLTWVSRSNRSELVHNLAVCLWICANSTWMVGEFFYDERTKPQAQLFFLSGLTLLAIYYVSVWIQKMREKKEHTE
jgi:hypothetical protein